METVFRSKFAIIAASIVSLLAIAFVAAPSAGASYVQDCKTNSIMKCGAGTPSDFITKTQANAPGDLKTVYADYGLVSSDYSRFVSSARAGVVYKSDGRIVVDGQTVATNAYSLGRESKSYSTAKSIGGKTYYQSSVKDVMLNDTLPVMVMFDSKGVMQFAVMDACGNPMTATKVVPSYSCDQLTATAYTAKKDTYNFTVKTSAANGAKVVKAVFDLGDGTTGSITDLNTVVQHTYKTPGTYTATVTVYVSLPGNQTVTVTSVKCKTVVTIAKPQTPPVTPTTPKPCAIKPSVPENSPECKPCEYNAQLPADSPECKKPEQPQVLVNTGTGSVLGIFTVSSIAAGLGYRRFLLRRNA